MKNERKLHRRPPSRSRAVALLALGVAAACTNQTGQAQQAPDRAIRTERSTGIAAKSSPTPRIAIPDGKYPIGRDTGPPSQRPAHSAVLAAFQIDRVEVTNAQFAEFLDSLKLPVRGSFRPGGVSARNGSAEALRMLSTPPATGRSTSLIELDDGDARIALADGRFQAVAGFERHPVTEVTWIGARAYCRWRGGDLPSEAQWEAAARGGDDRSYPWGNALPDSKRMVWGGPVGSTETVGSRPAGASPFGVLDMAGSLAEWTSSLKRPYPYRADDGREATDAPGERTTRGGDYEYDSQPVNYSVSFRDGFSNDPRHGHRHVGLRCVWSDVPR